MLMKMTKPCLCSISGGTTLRIDCPRHGAYSIVWCKVCKSSVRYESHDSEHFKMSSLIPLPTIKKEKRECTKDCGMLRMENPDCPLHGDFHKYDCTCYVTKDGCTCGQCGGNNTCSSECKESQPSEEKIYPECKVGLCKDHSDQQECICYCHQVDLND